MLERLSWKLVQEYPSLKKKGGGESRKGKNILLGQMTRLQVQDIKYLFLIETFSRQKDKSSNKVIECRTRLKWQRV